MTGLDCRKLLAYLIVLSSNTAPLSQLGSEHMPDFYELELVLDRVRINYCQIKARVRSVVAKLGLEVRGVARLRTG